MQTHSPKAIGVQNVNKIDLLSLTAAENACRSVEYHANTFSVLDLTRIKRIIAGQKPYNELYDVCPLTVDGVRFESADGLVLTGSETLVRHPDGQITQADYDVMQKLILYGIRPSALTTAAQ